MKKRLVSMFLILAMCMGLAVPAFAADYEDLTLERAKNIIGKYFDDISDMEIIDATTADTVSIHSNKFAVIFDNTENPYILVGEDYSNGDAELNAFVGSTHTATSYIDRSLEKVTYENYIDMSSDVFRYPAVLPAGQTLRASVNYTYLGRIRYTYGYNSDICGATVYFNSSGNPHARFNVAGQYKDMLALVSVIATIGALPVSVASSVAAGIIASLGSAAGVGSFFIPDKYIDAVETTNRWKVNDTSNASNTYEFVGSKYEVTVDGKSETYTTEIFYEKSAFTGKSREFGFYVFPLLFNAYTFDIYDWYVV